jgi:putative ABC transport system permease protein
MTAISLTVPRSRFRPADALRVGLLGLGMRRLRTALSAVGIAIGIAAMVGVLGISRSSQSDLLAQIDRLGTNLLTVQAGQTFGGASSQLPSTAVRMVRRIGPVQAVSSTASVSGNVYRNELVPSENTNGITVAAADTNLLRTLAGSVRAGTYLTRATARYPVAVLGSVAAQRLGLGASELGTQIVIGHTRFTVAGILDAFPLAPDLDRAAIIGYPASVTYLGADGVSGTIYLRSQTDQVDNVRAVLPASVNPENPNEGSVSQPSDALQARAEAESAFTGLFLGLGAVALIVGGVGIANVMVIAVLERRREIGLRRATGATRRHIRVQFLVESLLLSAVGGAVGVSLGVLATASYAAFKGTRVLMPWYAPPGGWLAAVAIGGLAGIYPAIRAARLTPTEALHTT